MVKKDFPPLLAKTYLFPDFQSTGKWPLRFTDKDLASSEEARSGRSWSIDPQIKSVGSNLEVRKEAATKGWSHLKLHSIPARKLRTRPYNALGLLPLSYHYFYHYYYSCFYCYYHYYYSTTSTTTANTDSNTCTLLRRLLLLLAFVISIV